MNALPTVVKSHWQLQSPFCRYAIRLSLACFITIFISKMLNSADGYWAVFSVVGCTLPMQGVTLKRLQQRVLGTFLGMWLGIFLACALSTHFIMIDILLFVFIFFMFYTKAFNYCCFVFFATVVTVLLVCLLEPGDWHVVVIRLEMTLLGVIIALIMTLAVLPLAGSKQLPKNVSSAMECLQRYFISLSEHYRNSQNHYFRALRGSAFAQLQTVFASIKDSSYELYYTKATRLVHARMAERLALLYEKMVCLEVYRSNSAYPENLKAIFPSLDLILAAMAPLFERADVKKTAQISAELADLLLQITACRVVASQDAQHRAASFHDYMQLSLFVETLQALLFDLHSFYSATNFITHENGG